MSQRTTLYFFRRRLQGPDGTGQGPSYSLSSSKPLSVAFGVRAGEMAELGSPRCGRNGASNVGHINGSSGAQPMVSPTPPMPYDVLERILSYLDVHTLCTARMVNKEFKTAASKCFKSLTLSSRNLQHLDLDRYSSEVRIAIQPLPIRYLSCLSGHLRPQIRSVELEVDMYRESWPRDLQGALELLATLPNLHCLRVTTPCRGMKTGPYDFAVMYDRVGRACLGRALAPMFLSASVRELCTPLPNWYSFGKGGPLVGTPLLTSLKVDVGETGYSQECLSRLSNLRVLDIASPQAPRYFVSHLSHLEQLNCFVSPVPARQSSWSEWSIPNFLRSIASLPRLESLSIGGPQMHEWRSSCVESLRSISWLTSLTYLSLGAFSPGHMSCLKALKLLARLRVCVPYEGGWWVNGVCLPALEMPSVYAIMDDRFSSLPRLTALTQVQLTLGDTLSMGWADSESSTGVLSSEGVGLPYDRLTDLRLSAMWMSSPFVKQCLGVDVVCELLHQHPTLTSFTTDNPLTRANIKVLAGMTRLRSLEFVTSPSVREKDLWMLTTLSQLTRLVVGPDDPGRPTTHLSAVRKQMGWPPQM